jgi:hypothetical protein
MAKPKDKQPWFKFYPQDWRGDAKLRMCSIGARGLWTEMLCLMHEAEPYGYLLINGNSVNPRQLAALAGVAQPECMKYMLELASAGVYSIDDETKTIYSRRMVRDKAKAEQAKNWGKGGGNPNLNGGDKGGVNPPVNGDDKPQKPLPNSINQGTAADARVLDEMGLKQEGLLRAAFIAECAGRPSAPDMSIIRVWLLDGISVATISGTVPPMLRRKADMVSLVYCDAAVREAHARAKATGPQIVHPPQDPYVLVIHGTPEHAAWDHNNREKGLRPLFFCKQIVNGVEIIAARAPTIVPAGYDEATGERLAPNQSEDAA